MATETDTTGTERTTEMSAEVRAVRDRIRRQRQLRWVLGIGVAASVLVALAASLWLIDFTVAKILRNVFNLVGFLFNFAQPQFGDITAHSRANGIDSTGSILPFSLVLADLVNGAQQFWHSLLGMEPPRRPAVENPQPFDPLGVFRPVLASLLHPVTVLGGLTTQTNLLGASVKTIAIGFAGTVVGLPFALTFGILGSERVTPFPFNFIFRGMMSTIRAIPALVWILIYVPLVGISPVGAFLAVATDTIGNLGRLFTDELEEIEDGPIEAIESTGASRSQVVLFGMLSQVSNGFIAWTLYILEINVRIAISLGVVGAGGIGQYIKLNIGQFFYGKAAVGILLVIVIVLSVELTSSRIRARLRPGEDSGKGLVEALQDLSDGGKWLGVDTGRN